MTDSKHSFVLSEVVEICPDYLHQFGLVKTRLTVPHAELDRDTDRCSAIPGRSMINLRKDAILIERELRSQHHRRSIDIIRQNKERAVTYWAAQQCWQHLKYKRHEIDQSSSCHPSGIQSPEVSFVMALATPNQGEDIAQHSTGAAMSQAKNGMDGGSHAVLLQQMRVGVVHRRPGSISCALEDGEEERNSSASEACGKETVRMLEGSKTAVTRFRDLPAVQGQRRGRVRGKKVVVARKRATRCLRGSPPLAIERLGISRALLAGCSAEGIDWMSKLYFHQLRRYSPGSSPNSSSCASATGADVSEKVWQRNVRLPCAVIPVVVPLPRSLTWVRVGENYLAEDEPVLRYIPYFGDDDTTGFDTSAYDYVPGELEADIGGEILETATAYLLDGIDDGREENMDNGISVEEEGDIVALPTETETCLMSALSLSVSQLRKARERGEAFRRNNSRSLDPNLNERLEWRLGSSALVPLLARKSLPCTAPGAEDRFLPATGFRDSAHFPTIAENFRDLFCRRCYIYDCRTHAIRQPLPRERCDPQAFSDLKNTPGNDTTRSAPFHSNYSKKRKGGLSDLKGKSKKRKVPTVHQRQRVVEDDGYRPPHILETLPFELYSQTPVKQRSTEGAVALKLFQMLSWKGDSSAPLVDANPSTVSTVARLLGTCSPEEAYRLCEESSSNWKSMDGRENDDRESTSPMDDFEDDMNSAEEEVAAYISRMDAKAKGRSLTAVRKEGMKYLYRPCNHDGPCVAGVCPCATTTGYCEPYCSCSASCRIRFEGCNCRQGQCRTMSCRCVKSGRECDPNLCLSCGAAVHPALRETVGSRSSTLGTTPADEPKYCCNSQLLLGRGKQVSIGRSSIHGWGVFIREPAQKGDFIMEYKGELISQDEADRRGKLFDKIDSTFLFNLNDEYVVDATRKGSKAKYANHSKTPNCACQIKLVKCDHRIGIYALRNLSPGDELTFDYTFREQAPLWSTKNDKKNDFLK